MPAIRMQALRRRRGDSQRRRQLRINMEGMAMKRWYSISAKADDVVEIAIFDEIGFWGVTAQDFKREFDDVKSAKEIRVSINSPGGSFFDGMAIYQMLSAVRERVDVEVYGIAASIASVIALAGRSMSLARGSYFMVHNPYTLAVGDAAELRKTADVLDKMRGDLAGIYAAKSGMDADAALAVMDAETWYTADEALEAGFADSVPDYGEVAARGDLALFGFAHTPQGLCDVHGDVKEIKTERQFERFLRDAGYSRNESETITARGFRAIRGEPEEPVEQGEPVQDRRTIPFRVLAEEAELQLALMEG
ncbi:MAG: Clp protease ClpP [Spirochaetaceae bacterium]|nr:MAG: Clp protease ClpP [Spirochaetaceae bacterium]